MFEHVAPFAGDPIFALVDAFHADPRAGKVNLSIGIYFDDDGRLPVLPSVVEAERRIAADAHAPKGYLPMEGDARCRAEVARLLLGDAHPALAAGRVATMQSVGSSGGLRVAAEFLRAWLPGADRARPQVWLSDPTWDNHRAIFEGAGFEAKTYPYHDPAGGGLRFDAMLDALRAVPANSVVLLHACCHNPTGVDPTRAQWREIAAVLRERGALALLDLAYQGFGDGIDDDAFAVRHFADVGATFFVANSFSKSMSVYGERCGALSAVCATRAEAELVLGQLKFTVRTLYSSPSIHAARLVAHVLGDAELRAMWHAEVDAMRARIAAMRRALHDALAARLAAAAGPSGRPRDVSWLLTQRGMFSYTGLAPAQVERLRDEHAVYLIRSGRMCVAGLNPGNVERVADALAAVMLAG